MRRIAFVCCLAAGLGACRPAASQSASRTPSRDDGKIPITTRSAEARGLFLRGRALNENLQAHEGHALFEQAVAADPAFAFGEYGIASTAPTARERSEHLRKALALAAKASPGERLLILGMQARTNADPARALQIAESLAVLYPRDERAHWVLANAFGARQRYDSAIVEYSAAIAINPSYSLAYNQLGYAYRSAGRMDEAATAFRRYIALVPNDPNPYDSYAELLMKTGRFGESIVQYRKALSIDPHFGGSFVGIAADEMYAGHHALGAAEAERYFSSARDDGERRTALATLAMIHVDDGATGEALRAMERSYGIAAAIGDTASMSADAVAIADILLEAGRIDAAQGRYRQAHDLVAATSLPPDVKQDDELARHYDLARLALARHDVRTAGGEAAAYLRGATGRRNDARLRQAHELNGLVALEAKQFDESLAELALADQQNPAVWYAMARAHAGKGHADVARQLSEQALHMNILPTLPYVFTRAALAAATRSARSGSARGRQS